MNTVIFNINNSKISPIAENLALRMNYLFCKFPILISDVGLALLIHDDLYKSVDSFELKAKIISERLINSTSESDIENLETIENIRDAFKKYKKIKHKNPELILTHKKMEKFVDNIFKGQAEELAEKIQRFGLYQLSPLLEKKEMDYFKINSSKEEEFEDLVNKYIKVSDVFKYTFDKANTVDAFKSFEINGEGIFCLTNEFFYEDFWNEFETINSSHPDAMNEDAIMLEHFFTFPSINVLTVVELRAIKDDLNHLLQPYFNGFNEWINLCKNNSPNSLSFFSENLLPHKTAIQSCLNENKIVQYISGMMSEDTLIELHVGTIPIKILLQYLEKTNLLTNNSQKVIQDYLNNNMMMNNKLPIIAIKLPNVKKAEEITEENLKPVKKYLSID